MIIPSCFTLGSMFAGYLAATLSLRGAFITAACLILCGGVMDAVDGPLARALGTACKFGGELDSFADLISFGLAPSLLLYRAYFSHWQVVGVLLGFIITAATALRLARYNIGDGGDREYFTGFTSTANGCLLASFVLFTHDLSASPVVPPVAAGLVLVSSALMVSGVPYMSLGKLVSSGVWKARPGPLWLVAVLLGVVVLFFPLKAFFPAMLTVMLQGPLGPRIDRALHHLVEIQRNRA
jgi:CDP-diacylglycerol--serine O-phosphatidyltransferase